MADNLPEKSDLAKREEETLKFWQDNQIFEKTLTKESPKGEFVFYDGPPFATGTPHYGHILASAIKDAVPRYKTMCGYRVSRRWGWDCHGLPVENIVEKELKISGKKQIEEIGVAKFNEVARSKVLAYVGEWKKTVERIGRWVDFDGSYKTMDNTYMESVWWALAEMNKKGLLYEGTRVLPYCPRCETPIANAEIAMDNSYKEISDISVFVKFKIKPGQKIGNEVSGDRTYLIAWTTTPWTLPGNTALAVGLDMSYSALRVLDNQTSLGVKKDDIVILADSAIQRVFGKYIPAGEIGSTEGKISLRPVSNPLSGRDLVGLEYQSLFDYYVNGEKLKNRDNGWKVYGADFVTTEDGTGIVHIAPGFGEDDMNLAKKENLPVILHVDQTGHFKPEVTDFAGMAVKPKSDDEKTRMAADIEVIKYLQDPKRNLFFDKQKIKHSYPHCFRCETPLYYYAIPAWFIKIQGLKPRLQELNQEINWIPEHLKLGRFAKSMEGAPDWNISRNRFWATPLPIWKCEKCKEIKVIGSLKELLSEREPRNNYLVMRHGETEPNVLRVCSNDHFGLTEKGKKEVELASDKLKQMAIDLIISSDYQRTKETAVIVAEKIGLKPEQVIFDQRLREINVGEFDGKKIDDYHLFLGDEAERLLKTPAGGESLLSLKTRVGEFIYELDKKYSGRNILLVTHGGVGWMLAAVSLEVEAEDILVQGSKKGLATGEFRELLFKSLPHNANFELDLHRPYIDEVELKCNCGGTMKRILEVIDCWFESGSMPFASEHYPFENVERTKSRLPADFVAEYIAQTRTWFYYMHVVSTVLFNQIPFRNVVTTGNVLAEDGQKMSKSKNNFPDPWLVFNQYGVDALRFHLLSSPLMKSEDLAFSEKGVNETYRKIISRLWNVYTFYEMYAGEHQPSEQASVNVLDKWINARLNQTIGKVSSAMDRYEIDQALRPVDFFIEDLSTWYLRRSRDRFKSSDLVDRQAAMDTTRTILLTLAKIMAPFTPFISEDIYLRLRGGKESVHLESWPEVKNNIEEVVKRDIKVLSEMILVRGLISYSLELRAKAGIKIRQPLSRLLLKELLTEDFKLVEYLELIKDELNVEEVKIDSNIINPIVLDTNLTPDLIEKGEVRELIREIQDWRKKQDLKPGERVKVPVSSAKKALAEKFAAQIKAATAASDFEFVE